MEQVWLHVGYSDVKIPVNDLILIYIDTDLSNSLRRRLMLPCPARMLGSHAWLVITARTYFS